MPVQLFHFLVFLFFMFFVYIRIKRIANAANKQMDQQSSTSTRKSKDQKTNVTIAAVLGAFTICYTPNFIISTTQSLGGLPIDTPTMEYVRLAAFVFAAVNSFLNPIIYCWKQERIRQAYKRILGFKVRRLSPESTFLSNTRLTQVDATPVRTIG